MCNERKKNGQSVIIYTFLIGFLVHISSCKKLVDIGPPVNTIVESSVFTVDATAIAVLNGIYHDMTKVSGGGDFTGSSSISVLSGLSADELTVYSGITNNRHWGYYRNFLGAKVPNVVGSEFWAPLYQYIYRCNAAIGGLNTKESENGLTGAIRQQLLGEALFMRGFIYFHLVNLFGDVPLMTSTDYKKNSLLPRSNVSEVYRQIIQDLEEAQKLLSEKYLARDLIKNTAERVRPTKFAAAALLARAYLYSGEYAKAEEAASFVIGNTALFGLTPLNDVFLKNSTEAIWQLQPSTLYYNTEDARTFVIPVTGPSNSGATNPDNPVFLSSTILEAFEAGDWRRDSGNWVNSRIVGADTFFYPFKYKLSEEDLSIEKASNISEYLMVLRLAEQYLIRAEARAQQNNLSGAQADLNTIRSRAGLENTMAAEKASLLAVILHERQVELFTEWGHRWFDLKRSGNIEAVMDWVTPLKGGAWEFTDQLYPIPLADILKNPNLTQNAGY